VAQTRDRVLQQSAARSKHPRELGGVGVDLAGADVLGHADARDRVEGLAGQLAVVRDADLDPVLEPELGHPPPRVLDLRAGEGDAEHADAVLARRVDREAAPPAADVEHTLAGLEVELAAHDLELLGLRLLERPGAAREDRAAVGHRRPEEEPEELGREVVVVADSAGVALAAVAPPARAQLGLRHARRRAQPVAARGRERDASYGPAVERRRVPAVEELEHGVEVVDVDRARDVGAPEPELAGRAQRVGGRVGRAHLERRAAPVRRGEDAAVPELDRERPGGKGLLELGPKRGGGGHVAGDDSAAGPHSLADGNVTRTCAFRQR
jgi:hypothetical protein